MTRNAKLIALAALTSLIAACGGHGGESAEAPAPAPAPSPSPAEVAGISTPSSVSVVTAKNAN
ncbi:MAG: hypothetical protein HZC37_00550 [Burkholderiales bacterium]|nr:hypothetical protein [Burkholderiales bacterium]